MRNILLGEPCSDWDIATSGNAPALARQLANKLSGHYAHLHDKASRVVVPLSSTSEIIFDISPLQGSSLEFDLRQRDFTINAIAAPLDDVVRNLENTWHLQGVPPHVGSQPETYRIDPLHGMADIQARRLKAVDGEVFRHDPLRMLRAVRLMMRYRLSMDGWTEGLLMRDSALLAQVAVERIHDELYAILAPDGATEQLQFLDAHGLLTVLIPEFSVARGMSQPNPHYWDVLEHSLHTVGKLEALAALLRKPPEELQAVQLEIGDVRRFVEIQKLLRDAEEQGVFHFEALAAPAMKLAALLHDIGKPATHSTDEEGLIHFYGHPQAGVALAEQVMKRLGASTQDRRLVQQVTAHHMRPGQLSQVEVVTPRAVRRYFVDLGPTGILVALFSLADHLATRGPMFGRNEAGNEAGNKAGEAEYGVPPPGSWEQHLAIVSRLLTDYIKNPERILPPRLVSAQELMRRLKLVPGPKVGVLLEHIAEAQADGSIHSKEEALWLAEEKLSSTE